MTISEFSLLPVDGCTTADIELAASWLIKNVGSGVCWTNSIMIHATLDLHDIANAQRAVVYGLCPPGEGIGDQDGGKMTFSFSVSESERIMAGDPVFFVGDSIYQDTASRRWQTGFAFKMKVDQHLRADKIILLSDNRHWFDKRLSKAGIFADTANDDKDRQEKG